MYRLKILITVLVLSVALVQFEQHHLECLQDQTKDCYFMMLTYPASMNIKTLSQLFDKLSETYSHAFEIVRINSRHKEYSQVCQIMGVNQRNLSISYYVSQITNPIKKIFTNDIRIQTLSTFCQQMINDRIITLRSQTPPQVQGQVIKLVGTTFNHYIVQTQTQTVMLIHNHQQTRSRFFLPKFQKLGQRLHRNSNLKFTTFNIALNQFIQNDEFEYLPNILFFHQSSIQPIYYQGPLRVDKLQKWLKQTTDNEWIQPDDESSEQGIQQHRK